MSSKLPQRPHTAQGTFIPKSSWKGAQNDHSFNTTNSRTSYTKYKKLHSLLYQPKKFENVETFNLNPGYRVSRSAGRVFVKINPNTFFEPPKPETSPIKLNAHEMESLLKNLQDQVSTLSTYHQEEQLRHDGTRKRAKLDLENLEKTLTTKHDEDITKLHEKHDLEKVEIVDRHHGKMAELHEEARQRYDKLTSEYRLLQASFKNYRSTLQEELNGQWKIKMDEMDWEKRRAVENAVDECKQTMEENAENERKELRKEFRLSMNDMLREHRQELDMVTKKFTGGDLNIEELKKRSFLLDDVQQELEDVKDQLEHEKTLVKKVKVELADCRSKLSILEARFEERVSSVEDKHRAKIEMLMLEKADAKLKIARSCDDLQSERMAREIAEEERRQAAIRALGELIKESKERLTTSEEQSTEVFADIENANLESDIEPEWQDVTKIPTYNPIDLKNNVESNKNSEYNVKYNHSKRKSASVSTAPSELRHPLNFTVPPVVKQVTSKEKLENSQGKAISPTKTKLASKRRKSALAENQQALPFETGVARTNATQDSVSSNKYTEETSENDKYQSPTEPKRSISPDVMF